MSTVLLLDLLFLHKYTKLDCQQGVYCAMNLYMGTIQRNCSESSQEEPMQVVSHLDN